MSSRLGKWSHPSASRERRQERPPSSRCLVLPRRKQLGHRPPARQVAAACLPVDQHRPPAESEGPHPCPQPAGQAILMDGESARSPAAPSCPGGEPQTAASCCQHFAGRGMFRTFIFSEGAGWLGREEGPGARVPGASLLSDVAPSVTRRGQLWPPPAVLPVEAAVGQAVEGSREFRGHRGSSGGVGCEGAWRLSDSCQSQAPEGESWTNSCRAQSLVSGRLLATELQGSPRWEAPLRCACSSAQNSSEHLAACLGWKESHFSCVVKTVQLVFRNSE